MVPSGDDAADRRRRDRHARAQFDPAGEAADDALLAEQESRGLSVAVVLGDDELVCERVQAAQRPAGEPAANRPRPTRSHRRRPGPPSRMRRTEPRSGLARAPRSRGRTIRTRSSAMSLPREGRPQATRGQAGLRPSRDSADTSPASPLGEAPRAIRTGSVLRWVDHRGANLAPEPRPAGLARVPHEPGHPVEHFTERRATHRRVDDVVPRRVGALAEPLPRHAAQRGQRDRLPVAQPVARGPPRSSYRPGRGGRTG